MTRKESARDDYEILGLTVGAGPVEVKKVFRLLAKEWHPDHFQERGFEERAQAEQKFREIAAAYRRISGSWKPKGNPAPDFAATPTRPRQAASTPRPVFPGDKRLKAAFAAGALLCAFMAAVVSIQPFLPDYFSPGSGSLDSPGEARFSKTHPQSGPEAPPVAPPDGSTATALLSEKAEVKTRGPLLLAPEEDAGKSYFTIGSSQAEVLRIQGRPERIQGQTWIYGLSEIHFRQGQVWRYNNFDGSLKIRLEAGAENDSSGFVTLGSTPEDVLRTHGTPTRVEKDRWFYGYSEIRFKDGLVAGYDNYFGNLNIRLLPAAGSDGPDSGEKPRPLFFTVGSTQDEVLGVQGTPSGVQGNLWTYNFASVYFRDGKVNYVLNSDGGLRFLAPDEIAAGGSNPGP